MPQQPELQPNRAGIQHDVRQGVQRNGWHAVWRYGLALIFVVLALFVSLAVRPFFSEAYLILFLAAVMASGWFCLTGPALFAVCVSILAVDYYFTPPLRHFVVNVRDVPSFLSFFVCALGASWLSSARKHAEIRRQAHFDELFEQAPEGIMLVDLQDNVLRINKEFSRMFGYMPWEVTGRSSTTLMVPGDLKQEAADSRKRLTLGQSVNQETRRIRKDGSPLYVSELAVPITVNGGRIAYYIIFRDITERKQAAEALARAQSELAHLSRVTTMGELVASISHEVNQPIGAVVTNGNAGLRFLSQKPPNLHEVQEAFECIVRDGNRAGAVIGRIRSLLKNTAPHMAAVNINELIRSVLILIDAEIRGNGVTLRTELEDSLPAVLGDRVQLQQVMLNLIMNSIDAMIPADAPRELHVSSLRRAEGVLVRVRDSGTGIDPNKIDCIFDAFFTTKPDGIGMGLSISRSIIEAHGGKLWATEGSPAGAVFEFTLPMANGHQ